MLPHLVYFDTLSEIKDESTPEWKVTLAGLVVLRLIDDWLEFGVQVVTTDVTGLKAVRDAVGEIAEGNPIRTILFNTIEAVEKAETAEITSVVPPLMAYGRALHYDSQWKLSRDVFQTVFDHSLKAGATEHAIQASLRLGFVCRRLGDLTAAEAGYGRAQEMATAISDAESCLTARLGFALVTIARGNLPQADTMLGTIINEARSAGLISVLAPALHDRAYLYHTRGDYANAVRAGYAALEATTDPLARDRILADLAAFFSGLGHLAAARDANLMIMVTSQEDWLRNQAHVNLMDLEAESDNEPQFLQYYKAIKKETLMPQWAAMFHLFAGRGFQRFGHLDQAREELQCAFEVATAHELNQLAFEAESALKQVTSQERAPAKPASWPADLDVIASAIGEMRQLSVAGVQKNGVAV